MTTSVCSVDDLFSVEGKNVLVTGGGRGIGLMIASGFVANGANVAISSRSADVCDEVANMLSMCGPGKCLSFPADLTKEDEVAQVAEKVGNAFGGKLHALINNSGAAWGASFDAFPKLGFRKVLELCVDSVFFCTQKCMPLLEAAASHDNPATVVNIGSIDGIAVPSLSENYSYSAAKAGVHHMSRHMAKLLADRHVTINNVAPGPFVSKMTKQFLGNDEGRETVASAVPLRRIGVPDDMAGVCIFLCSRAGRYVTGATIKVDGGAAL